jgi:hypothetical protein
MSTPPIANNWEENSASSGSSLTIANYTIPAGVQLEMLVVGTAAKDLGGAVGATKPTGVTWGGVPLTLVKEVACTQEATNESGTSLWCMLGPGSGTGDIVVTWSESQSAGIHAFACYLTNVAQDVPVALTGSKSATADTATFTQTLSAVPENYLIIDALALSGPTAGGTEISATAADQTARINQSVGSGASRLLGSEKTVLAADDKTLSWATSGGGSGRYAAVIAAFETGGLTVVATRRRSIGMVAYWHLIEAERRQQGLTIQK